MRDWKGVCFLLALIHADPSCRARRGGEVKPKAVYNQACEAQGLAILDPVLLLPLPSPEDSAFPLCHEHSSGCAHLQQLQAQELHWSPSAVDTKEGLLKAPGAVPNTGTPQHAAASR